MKEECGARKVIMGGCRHSIPLVEELRICRRRGEGRCHSRGNGLDGLFGAENRGIVLKNLGVSGFVHGCVALFVSRMCIALQGSVVDSSQTRGKKIPQHRHCSTGLLWNAQMMSSEWSYLRVSWYCSG